MNLNKLSNQDFLENFSSVVKSERRITAEIIEYVKEMDRRQLYLEIGFTSLFEFMTKHLGYTPGSAQRRIDSARMLKEVPELKEKLQSGAINLMQVSTLAKAVREKEKTTTVSTSEKREILATIEALDVQKSEVKIAQMLDVPIKVKEVKRLQKDESVRMEVTLSKSQMELLEQVKSLISHTHTNPTMVEVFEYLANRFVQKKMGRIERTSSRKGIRGGRVGMTARKIGNGFAECITECAIGNRRISSARSEILRLSPQDDGGFVWMNEALRDEEQGEGRKLSPPL